MNASDTLVLLLQTGFVLLVVLAAGFLARKAPAFQSSLYRLCIIAVLALAIGSPWLNERPKPVVPIQWAPATATVTIAQPTAVKAPEPVAHAETPAPTDATVTTTSDLVNPFDWLAMIWMAGVALLSVHLGLGYQALARIRRSSRTITDPSTLELLKRTAMQAGTSTPLLLESSTVSNPFVAGIRHPAIYLPEDWHKEVDRETLQAVLRHEMAHITNGDLKWNLVHRVACIVLWPQLLLWLLRKPMSAASEQLCDRHVLGSGIPETRYAECLLSLRERLHARPCPSLGIGAVSSKSFLAKRVEAILDGKRSRAVVLPKGVSATLRVSALAIAAAAALIFARPTSSQEPYDNWVKAPYAGKVKLLAADGKPVTGASAWVVFTGDVPQITSKRLQVVGAEVTLPTEAPPKCVGTILVQAAGHGLSFARAWPAEEKMTSLTLSRPVSIKGQLLLPDGNPAAEIAMRLQLLVRVFRNPENAEFMSLETIPEISAGPATDSTGHFSIDGLPPSTTVAFDVADNRFSQLPFNARIDTGLHGASAPGPIRLLPAARLQGRVTRDGKPVAGFGVGAQGNNDRDRDNNTAGSAITDKDGRYTMQQMRPGVYNVIADLRGSLGKEVTAIAHEAVTVKAGETISGIDFELIPGVIVEGTVVDAAGKPVKETYIGIYGPAHPRSSAWVQGSTTDAHGYYTMRVPPGKQHIYVSDSRYEAPARDLEVTSGARVDFQVKPVVEEEEDDVAERLVTTARPEPEDMGPVPPVASFGPGKPFYGPFKLKNGAIARLAFLQNDADGPHTVWHPNGSKADPTDVARSLDLTGFTKSGANPRSVFLRVDIEGVERGSYSCAVEVPHRSQWSIWQSYGDMHGRGMDLASFRAPESLKVTDMRFGIAAGRPKLLLAAKVGQAPLFAKTRAPRKLEVPGDASVTVTLPKGLKGKEVTLEAYDRAGKMLELAGWQSPEEDASTGELKQSYSFRGATPDEVARVQLFTRDYEWVTFKGIHLYPK
ncbi:MAG: M56 family metallopeptidase [Fimbriimonas sp.]